MTNKKSISEIIFVSILICSIGTNLYHLLGTFRNKSDLEDCLEQANYLNSIFENQTGISNQYRTGFYNMFGFSQFKMSMIKVVSENLDTTSFDQESLKKTLIYRFSPNHCYDCIQSDLMALKKVIDANENVLILTDHKNVNLFKNDKDRYQICHPAYINLNWPTEYDKVNQPYFCFIDSNGSISNVFYSFSTDPKLTEFYLGYMKTYMMSSAI